MQCQPHSYRVYEFRAAETAKPVLRKMPFHALSALKYHHVLVHVSSDGSLRPVPIVFIYTACVAFRLEMISSADRAATNGMATTVDTARSQYRLEDMEIKNALGERNSTYCCCVCDLYNAIAASGWNTRGINRSILITCSALPYLFVGDRAFPVAGHSSGVAVASTCHCVTRLLTSP